MTQRPAVAALAIALVAAAGGCRSSSGGSRSADREPASPTTTDAATNSRYGKPTLLATVDDPDIDENSGMAASRRNPGLIWAHNDSGDGPFLYCLDRAGRSCGVWSVAGGRARDWEDMAAGPGPVKGQPYLYAGDIGDNLVDQPAVTVYRVAEPAADPGDGSSTDDARKTATAEVIRLRYSDGPHDSEALMVHPVTGDLYVVAKSAGAATVYKAASAELSRGGTGTLSPIATVALGAGEWVTGADISPDGRRVVLCTYFGGYELTVPAGAGTPFDSVWGQAPVPVDLGDRAQGESVAYSLDGRSLLASSERSPAPLYEVRRQS